jgi:hypothetical protein
VVRSRRAVLLILSFVLLVPGLAQADGLYLNLKADGAKVPAGQPAKLQLTHVATHSFSLPGTPEFIVDGGATPEVRATETGGDVRVTPDKAVKAAYEVVLKQPGTYKVRARYRVNNKTIESNKVTVVVE